MYDSSIIDSPPLEYGVGTKLEVPGFMREMRTLRYRVLLSLIISSSL